MREVWLLVLDFSLDWFMIFWGNNTEIFGIGIVDFGDGLKRRFGERGSFKGVGFCL